ncbi:PilZ domain-containing protein [Sulfidibacter corallicola]|uniref:PilZ domain-containing protein n=1 Tax=Sulfidibacter corallicola TaxID=2818388 RepID=A0A8A4TD60_SULCO|nr:PilZ domain-containing protein [Sulfidibacter corallicola]QTD47603.1 PilZ domain-containing protein [Sulfidibacter corallicola]
MPHYAPRRFERFNCEMAVWIHPLAPEEPLLLAEVLNISGGGFLCRVDRELPQNQPLDISIELPQRENLVPVKGEVRHVRPEDEQTFLIGLEFTEIEGMTVPAFIAYIEAMFV